MDQPVRAIEVPLRASDLSLAAVVRWAIKSLYIDEALPRGPLVQWLMELLVGVKLDHRQIRGLLEATPGIKVEPPNSKKLSFRAVLEDPPPGFKRFVSEDDVTEALEAEVWQEASAHLARGGWTKADDLAHKYYVVASWLQDVSARFRGMSFGRVLSIVRCGAQHRALLGHRNGTLVPYAESEECERKVNARDCQPTAVAPDEQYVKTWGELQDCLRRLVREQKDETLEVSKIKNLFRNRFRRELSETVFGYQCLSKLLGDPRLGTEFVLDTMMGSRFMLRLSDADEAGTRASRPPQ